MDRDPNPQEETRTREGETRPRVALVTGGSRGIGLAVVEALLNTGWKVHFCSLSREAVELTEGRLRSTVGSRVRGHVVDVRRQQQVDALIAALLAEDGRLDCLVNNAGLGIFAPVDQISGDDFRRTVETNLAGPFYFLRAAAPAMRRQGSGFIFNIASLAGRHAFSGGAAYNASKFGLMGLSEAAMLDLRGHGIRVSLILPGSVDTDFHGGPNRSGRGAAQASDSNGAGWMLHPADVARTVLDLLRYPQRALPSLVELRPTYTNPG